MRTSKPKDEYLTPLTAEEIDQLAKRMKNSLLSNAEWERKLAEVQKEARKWKVTALKYGKVIDAISSTLRSQLDNDE